MPEFWIIQPVSGPFSRGKIIITRPRERARTIVRYLNRAGFSTLTAPMQEILPLTLDHRRLAYLYEYEADALLLSSANAARMIAQHTDLRAAFIGKPVCVVGRATARAARAARLHVVLTATGNLCSLRDLLAARRTGWRKLVHICGWDRSTDSGLLFATMGLEVLAIPVYRAILAESLPRRVMMAIHHGTIHAVLFHSARVAVRFEKLAMGSLYDLSCRDMIACCLSMRVASVLDEHAWRSVVVAARPDTESLLERLHMGSG